MGIISLPVTIFSLVVANCWLVGEAVVVVESAVPFEAVGVALSDRGNVVVVG